MRSSNKIGKTLGCLLSIAFAGSGIAQTETNAQNPQGTQNAMTAQEALSQIHTINQHEIGMGKMALEKASAPDVKDFARKMIKDHTQADKEVMKVAKGQSIHVQELPMTEEQKTAMEKLHSESGTAFDKDYMDVMTVGHAKALSMLQTAETQVSDPKVQKLIMQLMPKVQHHENLAKQIQASENKVPS